MQQAGDKDAISPRSHDQEGTIGKKQNVLHDVRQAPGGGPALTTRGIRLGIVDELNTAR